MRTGIAWTPAPWGFVSAERGPHLSDNGCPSVQARGPSPPPTPTRPPLTSRVRGCRSSRHPTRNSGPSAPHCGRSLRSPRPWGHTRQNDPTPSLGAFKPPALGSHDVMLEGRPTPGQRRRPGRLPPRGPGDTEQAAGLPEATGRRAGRTLRRTPHASFGGEVPDGGGAGSEIRRRVALLPQTLTGPSSRGRQTRACGGQRQGWALATEWPRV